MDAVASFVQEVNKIVWGWPLLVLLPGAGLFLTVRLRGLQFRQLCPALRLALCSRGEEEEGEGENAGSGDDDNEVHGDISHFQALMTALASTVGTGNVVGVATAISIGGPGAVFWMWVSAMIGMATKFSEAMLGVHFRVRDAHGDMSGGPMYYIREGVPGVAGRVLSAVFAVALALGCLPMVQSNAMADALLDSFSVPPLASAAVITVLAGAVVMGGVKAIGRATEFLVPAMIALYMGGGLLVLLINITSLPRMAWVIVRDAFSAQAATGGFAGASLHEGIRMGMARGVFSNEAGLGSAAIAAAAARTKYPVMQALISMTQTFIDTIVVCSVTALVIVATDAWTAVDGGGKAYEGVALTIKAFSTGLPGDWGGYIVSVSLNLFAFSTVIGWGYYGERGVEYMVGTRGIKPFRLLYLAATFMGAWAAALPKSSGFTFIWEFTSLMFAIMTVPNVIALIALAPIVVTETEQYFWARGKRAGGLEDAGFLHVPDGDDEAGSSSGSSSGLARGAELADLHTAARDGALADGGGAYVLVGGGGAKGDGLD